MSNAVKGIIGTVLWYEGAALSLAGAPEFGAPMMAIGQALLATAVVSQVQMWLGPKAPSAPPLSGSALNYSGTLEPRRILYGRLKVGGINCMPPYTSGANNDYIHQVLAFAGHPIDAFEDVYFGQTRIPTADIGSIPRTTSDGLLGGTTGYQGFAWIRRYIGTQTLSDYILTNTFTAWDASHVGYGIPYAAIQLKYDQKIFSGGFPQVTFMLRGKRVYDPRLDTTNGGSGAQRYTDSTTWTYSTNPALCLRDYLTSSLGLGEDNARINDTLVAAAASICDQTVTVPIPVLTGLTNWTNGSATVTGINTAFGVGLAAGYYLKAPNGSMLLIDAVPTDTSVTLHAAYSGANATGQVTQYNSSSATTKTQPRYTCNTLLDCTATFQANITTLAGAMMGHCLYSGGKWQMFAGAWTGSAFTLGVDDIVGTVSTQAGAPRANLYNGVRGNFIDPQSNYQPVEFPPILDASYTADDGEQIYVETNFPACIDLFEAQRNAILWNRFGRNQWVVTAQFGMSAFGVKVWETGTVTIPELGWNGQTVRCTAWKFSPQGTIELTLQEAYSADWADPASTDYVVKGVNVGPAAGRYVPYPPSGLTAAPVAGGIVFTVTLPDQVIPGTTIQLFEYTASTPFGSAALIQQSNTNTFVVPKVDVTQRYYWVRTMGPNGQVSAPYPAVTGLAGKAGEATNQWVTVGTVEYQSGAANKPAGSTDAWDSYIYTIQGHNTCHVSGKATWYGGNYRSFIGISSAPLSTGLDYGWYNKEDGTWHLYSPGSTDWGVYGTVSSKDLVAFTYDGTSVRAYINGVLMHTFTDAGKTFYGYCSFYDHLAAINALEFGPTTNLTVSDTSQINTDAVSQILSVYDGTGFDGISTGAYSGNSPAAQNSAASHITITTQGGPIAVDCTIGSLKIFIGAGTTTWGLTGAVVRDSTVIATGPSMSWIAGAVPWTANAYCLGIPTAFTFVDSQPAGTYDYALHFTIYSTSNDSSHKTGVVYSDITMKLREIRR